MILTLIYWTTLYQIAFCWTSLQALRILASPILAVQLQKSRALMMMCNMSVKFLAAHCCRVLLTIIWKFSPIRHRLDLKQNLSISLAKLSCIAAYCCHFHPMMTRSILSLASSIGRCWLIKPAQTNCSWKLSRHWVSSSYWPMPHQSGIIRMSIQTRMTS